MSTEKEPIPAYDKYPILHLYLMRLQTFGTIGDKDDLSAFLLELDRACGLSSQSSPGLRWVKASERLPNSSNAKEWCIRFCDPSPEAEWTSQYCNVEELKEAVAHWWCVEWLEETSPAQPIEGEQKPTDPWFTLKYVKTVLERGFPLEDIINLIGKKLQEHSNITQATEAQPIADGKEVPEEIMQWIEHQLDERGILAGSNIFKEGAIAMYHKMQEEIRQWKDCHDGLKADLEYCKGAAQQAVASKEIQIEGLGASNKEWGEKYLAVEKETLDYRKALEEILKAGTYRYGEMRMFRLHSLSKMAKRELDKYPPPTQNPDPQ